MRESKFRHVYGEVWKEKYDDLQLSTKVTESVGVRGNSKFVAIPWYGAGGAIAVLPAGAFGKAPRDMNKIMGHTGAVQDFEFSPFDENLLLSASEDATLKLWSIPDGGLTEHMREPRVTLEGHTKKVFFCTFNPSAAGIAASASFDCSCNVWDLDAGECAFSMQTPDQLYSLKWNYSGSLLAGTCKDYHLYIIDPRANAIVMRNKAHEGNKASRCEWVAGRAPDDWTKIFTSGFSKSTSDRQIFLWDIRSFATNQGTSTQPLCTKVAEHGPGPLNLHYDAGTQMLYSIGKGDGVITYYELTPEAPFLHLLSQFTATTSQKGFDFIPKRSVDVKGYEVMRGLKLEAACVQPISFKLTRRSGVDVFEEDIYPDCPSLTPALIAERWTASNEALPPVLQSMRLPGMRVRPAAERGEGFSARKSKTDVEAEGDEEPLPAQAVQTVPLVLEDVKPVEVPSCSHCTLPEDHPLHHLVGDDGKIDLNKAIEEWSEHQTQRATLMQASEDAADRASELAIELAKSEEQRLELERRVAELESREAEREVAESIERMKMKSIADKEQREAEDMVPAEPYFRGKANLQAPIVKEKRTEKTGAEDARFEPEGGYFACKKCGKPIYSYEAKSKSGGGWPAFDKCYKDAIVVKPQGDRVEITCSGCRVHLGHIFHELRLQKWNRSDQRASNSLALQYVRNDPPPGTCTVEASSSSLTFKIDLRHFEQLVSGLERTASRLVPGTVAATSGTSRRGKFSSDKIDLAGIEDIVTRLERAACTLLT